MSYCKVFRFVFFLIHTVRCSKLTTRKTDGKRRQDFGQGS